MAEKERKIVLVTGASQGIGAATAQEFVEAGYHAVLTARTAKKLEHVASEAGRELTTVVPCDVTHPGDISRLFSQIDKTFGRLDVVFNNAGTTMDAIEFGDVAFRDWRSVIGTNLDGLFLVARGAFRMMKAQRPHGGRIINNGSLSAHAPRIHSAAYTASKHAVSGLTKSISLDGRPYDIACGQIDIGNAESRMTDQMPQGVRQADGAMKVEPRIDVGLVAQTVVQMAELPLDVNIQNIVLMATKMPFVGRG